MFHGGWSVVSQAAVVQTDDSTKSQAQFNSRQYEFGRDGFTVSSGALLDIATVDHLRDRAERVLRGEYDTGRTPRSNSGGPDVAAHPSYIEAGPAHDVDRAISAAVRDPRLAEWAAKQVGARRLQVWNAMVMKKYPGGSPKTVVGWHQDQRYISKILAGVSINCWIALNEVSLDTGPMRFVPGSHLWGRRYASGFFEHDVDKQRGQIEVPEGKTWQEVESPLPPGWASLHHPMTMHGSGACYGDRPRYSFLVNYGVDDFKMIPGQFFATRIDNPECCPVVYEA
jgi:ectoine hydroxylase-related dioxygenase (phytanoyl-CoA dioxygenase family)